MYLKARAMPMEGMMDSQENYQPFSGWAEWASTEVSTIWSDALSLMGIAKANADGSKFDQIIRVEMRKAAIETGAIEGIYQVSRGITTTVAMEAALWESVLDEIGPDVKSHFAAQLEAFEMTLDLATRSAEITEVWIRQLHEVLCKSQETFRVHTKDGWQDQLLEHGTYKKFPNNVTLQDRSVHWYAPPMDVPAEMARLISELRSAAFEEGHPALQAAYVHHALTAIHPFADGNGRVARALASIYLYRGAGIPLVIYSDQVEPYWDGLASADRGIFAPFVEFISDRAVDTLNTVAIQLRSPSVDLEELAVSVRGQFETHGGLSHRELRVVAERLIKRVNEKSIDRITELALGEDVTVGRLSASNPVQSLLFGDEYQGIQSHQSIGTVIACNEPVQVNLSMLAAIGIAVSKLNKFTFIVVDNFDTSIVPIKFRLSEVYPAISIAADSRIETWVEYAVATLVQHFELNVGREKAKRGIFP